MFCLDIDHDVRLHIYNTASVHMNPSRWIEGGEYMTRHERPLALCGDLCDFQRMHHINVVHWVGYSTHMHASHTSINMFGTHACNNGCLWTHSHSLGYGRQAYIYSWARVDVHHFDQRRERLPGWIYSSSLLRVTV